jgi:hypothetical protein
LNCARNDHGGTTQTGGSGTMTGAGGLSTGATSLTYTGDQIDAGAYYVTAHYAGDANHLGSDGVAVAITIQQATLPVVVTSDYMLAGKTPPALTGTINGNAFTGSSTFTTSQGDTLTVTLSSSVRANSRVGTYAIVAAVTGAASANYVQPTSGTMCVVTIGHDAGTGPRNVAFWGNKDNAKLITAADLTALENLNLVNGDGSAFHPTTAAQLQTWLSKDTGILVQSLSIQLAVMELNVLSGYVKTTDVMYAGKLLQFVGSSYSVTGLDGGGFITVGNLMTLANDALAKYSTNAKEGSKFPLGLYLDGLENALEAANKNTSFVV